MPAHSKSSNNLSRRTFINLTAAATTGLLISPALGHNHLYGSEKYSEDMGIQLWSISQLLKSNLDETLEKLSEIGFTQVEFPMFQMVETIASNLANNGLKPTSRHFPFAYLSNNWDHFPKYNIPIPNQTKFEAVIEDAEKNGLKYLVMPYIFPEERGDIDRYKEIATELNQAGELCKSAGIQLSYHNHHFEFRPINGTLPFSIIESETDPDLLSFQIDVPFIYLMGNDPATFIKRLGNRVSLLHLKDLNKNIQGELLKEFQNKPIDDLWDQSVELGTGSIDFKSILQAAKEVGVDNCYVELEGKNGNSLDIVMGSFEHLKQIDL